MKKNVSISKKSEWGHRKSSGVKRMANVIINMLPVQWSPVRETQETAGFVGPQRPKPETGMWGSLADREQQKPWDGKHG